MNTDKSPAFYVIPAEEYLLSKAAKEAELTDNEWKIIIKHEKTFVKFLEKTRVNMKFELSNGKHRWTEDKVRAVIDAIDYIIGALFTLKQGMAAYYVKQEKEKKKK